MTLLASNGFNKCFEEVSVFIQELVVGHVRHGDELRHD